MKLRFFEKDIILILLNEALNRGARSPIFAGGLYSKENVDYVLRLIEKIENQKPE